MRLATHAFVLVITLLAILLSVGCTTSVVREQHSLFSKNTDSSATVYFVRPRDQRSRGVVDSDINVQLNDETVANLSVGEYVAVRIRPGKTEIMLRNMSYIASRPIPEEVWRSMRTVFEPGKTYYVLANMKMEEFRGVYFVPEIVEKENLNNFRELLKPAGKFATANPIF